MTNIFHSKEFFPLNVRRKIRVLVLTTSTQHGTAREIFQPKEIRNKGIQIEKVTGIYQKKKKIPRISKFKFSWRIQNKHVKSQLGGGPLVPMLFGTPVYHY